MKDKNPIDKVSISKADIAWDEQGLPHSPNFDDIYFSKASGIDESEYVFLAGNDLSEAWKKNTHGKTFCIGETGFGTGLNFLVAWRLWNQCKENTKNTSSPRQQLQFYSVEKYPLSREDLRRALALWPELTEFSEALIQAYPPQPINGLHKMQFQNGEVSLSIFFGEATEGFKQLASISKAGPQVSATPCSSSVKPPKIHAWFLDGFAPAKNPQMWTPELYQAIKALSQEKTQDENATSFATFTAAGDVRRGLQEVGFECKKRKGFGRKREMLVGSFIPQETFALHEKQNSEQEEISETRTTPKTPQHFRQYKQQKIDAEDAWHLIPNKDLKPIQSCIVIGGGLAGCHTARALAEKGIQVTVIEKNAEIAEEASGNLQGAVYAKLSAHKGPISRFNLASLLFANQLYQAQNYYRDCGEQCGVLHFAKDERQQLLYKEIVEHFSDKEFAQWLSPEESENISGVEAQFPALFLPQAGWLAPRELCSKLLKHANIRCILGQGVKENIFHNQQWRSYDDDNNIIAEADALVLCTAYDVTNFSQSQHLPLKQIRGQVSHLPSTKSSEQLRSVLCGDGYTPPPHKGRHTFGATFTLHNSSPAILQEDHQQNFEKLVSLSPDFHTIQSETNEQDIEGKVGFRCTTPDYFPAVGPIADFDAMKERFAFLRKKANAVIDSPGVYHPHLYCNIAHGSRGLCYTPLCSELLACIMTGQFLPIARELYRHLHPARFIIRDLMRNKI